MRKKVGLSSASFPSASASPHTSTRLALGARAPREAMTHDVERDVHDTVRVLVRVRPPNAREIDAGYAPCVQTHGTNALTLQRGSVRESVAGKAALSFAYDHVCDQSSAQEEIFERVGRDAVDGVVEGYHGCVLAYGQTGAGKTYSMQGVDLDRDDDVGGFEGDDDCVIMSPGEAGGAEGCLLYTSPSPRDS